MKKDKKAKSKKNKNGKKPFFTRVKNFFKNIGVELKRVVWPDKKKLKQNTATVLVIIIVAAVLIWVVDALFNVILTKTGFYAPKDEVVDVLDPEKDDANDNIIEVTNVNDKADDNGSSGD